MGNNIKIPKKLELYEFTDFNMEKFIDEYLYEVNPHEVIDESSLSTYSDIPVQMKMTDRRSGARNSEIIENKCRYLQDVIIRLGNSSKDNVFSLNASMLQKVLGKDYKPLLEIFIKEGYIKKGDDKHYWFYRVGMYSTLYTLLKTNTCKAKPILNLKIQRYKMRMEELLQEYQESIYRVLGNDFIKHYQTSLSYIKIDNPEGYSAKVNELLIQNPNAEAYYNALKKELEKKVKHITKVDNCGRIYHVLTNLKKELKPYISIDYSLDCKNSHPLLINYFIFRKHNISIPSSYNISSFLKIIYKDNKDILDNPLNVSLSLFHNVGNKLRNLLINNNIEIQHVAKLSDDELAYIYLTSNGFWDAYHRKYPNLSKGDLKEAVFGGVFYINEVNADKFNDYARDFELEFPEVFKLINEWKKEKNKKAIKNYLIEHHLYAEKDSAALSIVLMALEAQIFKKILERLYVKRWNAVHIHDCIVVPKDCNKNHPTREQVLQVMQDVYKEYGLAPTIE